MKKTVWAVFDYNLIVIEYGTREAMQALFKSGSFAAIGSKQIYIRKGETLSEAMHRPNNCKL